MSNRYEMAKKYTEKYKDRLHPCKYCGNKNINIVSDRTLFDNTHNVWSVCCSTPNCDCTGTFEKVEDAVQCWENKH